MKKINEEYWFDLNEKINKIIRELEAEDNAISDKIYNLPEGEEVNALRTKSAYLEEVINNLWDTFYSIEYFTGVQ